MIKILKITPFILLTLYYLMIFNSKLDSTIKLYIAVLMAIISIVIYWFIHRKKMNQKNILTLSISIIITVLIAFNYFLFK